MDYYIDRPAATTILSAAKISGKTGRGTSIGILESVTQREVSEFVDENGRTGDAVIEPRANYLVARVKQDVFGNSSVGVMATAVNQRQFYPDYTGGLDWSLRFRGGDYECTGQVVGSRTGPGEDGWGGVVMLEKEGGKYIRGSLRGEYRDRRLDLNRLGFLSRADTKRLTRGCNAGPQSRGGS